MIYQSNNDFKVFKFKASYSDEDVLYQTFVSDKALFERDLIQRMKDLKPDVEPVLPQITYSDVILTTEEQIRFDEVKALKLSLDEVREYVINSKIPNTVSYQVVILNQQVQILQAGNVELTTMLVDGGVL